MRSIGRLGWGSPNISSVDESYGSFYVSTALTNIAFSTPLKLAGAGITMSNLLKDFTHTTPNRLTYIGSKTGIFETHVSFTVSHSVNNTIISFYIAKDGNVILNSKINRKMGVGGDIGAGGLNWMLELSTNNYIEIFTSASIVGTTTVELMNVDVSLNSFI